MTVAIVTGSGGLVGSAAVLHLVNDGYEVCGIENDMRAQFLGEAASTSHVTAELVRDLAEFRWLEADVRDRDAVERIFAEHASRLELVIHCAAQPSHDWA